MNLVLPTGVQPAKSSVESAVPLAPGDGRLVRAVGIEPNTSCLEDRHAAHYATPAGRSDRSRMGSPTGVGVMAESTGIEPVRPEGLDALAPRCLTARPTLQSHHDGALDWTRTSIGPFRRRLTIQLVHERMLEAPAGTAPAHSGFADRRVPVSPRGQIGCAHRSRTCLSGFRVRCLADRPARDDGLGSVLRPRASAAQTRCSSTRALPRDWPSRQDSNLHTFAFVARCSSS
jgi:hypothetical protein